MTVATDARGGRVRDELGDTAALASSPFDRIRTASNEQFRPWIAIA
jgi:hypothetical protein